MYLKTAIFNGPYPCLFNLLKCTVPFEIGPATARAHLEIHGDPFATHWLHLFFGWKGPIKCDWFIALMSMEPNKHIFLKLKKIRFCFFDFLKNSMF